jgi:hypothetical protein
VVDECCKGILDACTTCTNFRTLVNDSRKGMLNRDQNDSKIQLFLQPSVAEWYRKWRTFNKEDARVDDVISAGNSDTLILNVTNFCRNADAKAKVKKARQAMRAQAGKSMGPLESPEDNMRLKQGIRKSIDEARLDLQKRRKTADPAAPSGTPDWAWGFKICDQGQSARLRQRRGRGGVPGVGACWLSSIP